MMQSDPYSLDRLQDIVGPEPVSWWPPATFWWFLFAMIVVWGIYYVVLAVYRWIQNAYRRQALHELSEVVQQLPGAGLICARDFSAKQSWKPDSSDFRVGDGIIRTIERSVEGTPGMALTPIQSGEIEHVRVYPKQPDVDDRFNRGDLTGKRTDSVTYMFEAPGQVQLPSIRVSWWDLAANKLQNTELEGRKLDIAPAEETVADAPPTDTDQVGDRRVRDARQRWQAECRAQRIKTKKSLPPLNPTSPK